MAPFKASYAKDPLALTRYETHAEDPLSVKDILQNRDAFLHQLKENLSRA